MKRITAFLLCIISLLCLLGTFVPAQAAQGPKLLALTFDDGPSKYTDKLLDGLKERGAKATFFMVGSNVNAYPETVKRMKKEGHQLATHTMSHANLALSSVDNIKSEVFGVNDRINAIVGDGKYYLRPPYGSYNDTVKRTVMTPIIYWSVDTEDWKSRNTQSVYNKIMNTARDGDIILLHDLYLTSVEGALKAVDSLQQQGYVFVTVEQLLRRRGIVPTDGTVYFDAPNRGINLPGVVAPVIATRNTILGKKVIIGRYSPSDHVFYTADGQKPGTKSEQYTKSYYIREEQTVQAVSVGESELSEISKEHLTPEAVVSKNDLDKLFYYFRSTFLAKEQKFVIGMKI